MGGRARESRRVGGFYDSRRKGLERYMGLLRGVQNTMGIQTTAEWWNLLRGRKRGSKYLMVVAENFS